MSKLNAQNRCTQNDSEKKEEKKIFSDADD